MKYRKVMKSNIRIMTDEDATRRAILRTAERLRGYEYKLVEETFITAIEFYLDWRSPIERQHQVKEILDVYEDEIKRSS